MLKLFLEFFSKRSHIGSHGIEFDLRRLRPLVCYSLAFALTTRAENVAAIDLSGPFELQVQGIIFPTFSDQTDPTIGAIGWYLKDYAGLVTFSLSKNLPLEFQSVTGSTGNWSNAYAWGSLILPIRNGLTVGAST